MKRRILSALLASVLGLSLIACSSEEAATSETTTSDTTYVIGISQFAEHGSLDNCREGFVMGLEQEGIVEGDNLEIIFDNAQADIATASTIADNYVSQKVNLICAIATPAATAAYNSTMSTDIPVVYTAISDPVEAGLADQDGNATGNVTGTSDTLPVEEQLALIRKILPDAKKIGILYNTSEANSISTIATYKKLASDYDFEIVESGVNSVADVDLAAADLVGKVDCISNLTDNTVVSALQTVLSRANAQGIPVFGSEVEQVKAGCLAGAGLDYVNLGIQTGKMAAKILKGEAKASDMKFETLSEPSLYVNSAVAEALSITVPEDVTNVSEVFDTIEAK